MEFRTIANRLITCNHQTGMALLKKFMVYIDENEIVSEYIKQYVNPDDFEPVERGTCFSSMGDTKQEEISYTYQYLKYAVEDWAKKEDIITNIETYASAESFLFQYEECKNYQILLLDVEMSGMSGIDLAKKIRQNQDNVEIIFITSHFEFIGVGYEVDALHYLVKPVKAGKMEEVLSKAKCKIEAGEPSIIIHYEGEVVKLYEKEILYLESLSHYVTIYTKGKEYKIKANISTFAQKLSEDFYQTHRSYLVSLKHIMRISRDSVTLDNGGQVPLARGKYDQINRAYIERN